MSHPSPDAFEAAIAAEDAARFTPPAPEPPTPPQSPEPPEPPEPPAPEAKPPQSSEPPEPGEPGEPAPEDDDEEASVAHRIKRAHIEAREAKRRAKLLEQELAVLRGQRTETRDETVTREAQQLAEQIAAQTRFIKDCDVVAAAGRKTYPDFDSSMAALWEATGGINVNLIEAAIEAGDAHKTLRYLGRNPDEAERIGALPLARQGAALAKLATTLATAKPKPVSKAPPPITPPSGGATSADVAPVDPEKMSMAQFAKWSDAEDRKRRAARLG